MTVGSTDEGLDFLNKGLASVEHDEVLAETYGPCPSNLFSLSLSLFLSMKNI